MPPWAHSRPERANAQAHLAGTACKRRKAENPAPGPPLQPVGPVTRRGVTCVVKTSSKCYAWGHQAGAVSSGPGHTGSETGSQGTARR